jgi:allene oxide cyclase-like protein
LRTKFRLIAALVAIVALGALVAAPAASANAGGKKFKTLRIVAEEKQSQILDLGDTGPSLGDEFVLSERLFVRGRQSGESGVVCVVTQAMPPYDVLTLKCEIALSLRKGQITLQGLIEAQNEDDPGPFRFAITGGTGKFRCACGEAVVRQVTDTRSVYRLRIATCKKKDKGKDDDRRKKDNGR